MWAKTRNVAYLRCKLVSQVNAYAETTREGNIPPQPCDDFAISNPQKCMAASVYSYLFYA